MLSREAIVRAAVKLADREGVAGLTIRRLADELGSGAMSLYHHLPNKDALLDAMVDAVFAEIELPSLEVDWRIAMRARAISTRAALRRHPWAVGRMESTTVPGPADLRLHDAVLGCLLRAGFSVELAIQAYSLMDAYIYGFALQQRELPHNTRRDFARAAGKQVQRVEAEIPDVARLYPNLAVVVGGYVADHGYSFDEAFEFGLDIILEGLEGRRDKR